MGQARGLDWDRDGYDPTATAPRAGGDDGGVTAPDEYELVALDHVQLAMPPGVEAEASAEAFYCGVLGLDRIPKPSALAARGGCWFRSGQVEVHLGVEADFRPARKAHPAFRVHQLDHLVGRIEASGLSFRWDTELPAVRRGYVDDPFGNRVELIDAGKQRAHADSRRADEDSQRSDAHSQRAATED
jgi:catechol 2,3-dioxygenase-like lactoylglutathione lyase family enzyme